MSCLEECIVAVVRIRSGPDAGKLDNQFHWERFKSQDTRSLMEIRRELLNLMKMVDDRMREISKMGAF